MRVLCDIHHEELYESLRILFEDRLGYQMYKPIGLEWFYEGYWNLAPYLDYSKRLSSAIQYLTKAGEPYMIPLANERLAGDRLLITYGDQLYRRYVNMKGTSDYLVRSTVYDKQYKCITLEEFKQTQFDILVSTVPEHIDGFNKLIKLYQPHAKHIFQSGNPWKAPEDKVKNILTSTTATISDKVHCCYYHQEFDLNIFSYTPSPKYPKRMFSMMHYLDNLDIFLDIERALSDWDMKMYGAGCRDGLLGPKLNDIATYFKDSGILWHVKWHGEGYGYNVHHAFATGTPVIVRIKHFKGMAIDPLLVDTQTCIDLDGKSLHQVIDLMQDIANNYSIWSSRVYKRFKEVVDFDKEFEDIKLFLERLQ